MNRSRMIFPAGILAVLLLAACSSAPSASSPSVSPSASAPNGSPSVSPIASASPQSAAPTAAPAGTPSASASPVATAVTPEEPPVEGQPPTAREAATTVLRALKAGDLEQVAAWVHPDKGVRFSPYASVQPDKDQVIKREELAGLKKDSTKRLWGQYDGSGEDIRLSYAEYHKKFVYDADFLTKGKLSVNEVQKTGNTKSNLSEVYPPEHYSFVEFHIAGIDKSLEGMDWRSLRLVFEKMDGGDYALVGIVHDQWTI
ncbi:hypothetical protein [Gorillibacterium sp. sgz500922]|uniref:hypothetical protein n=1 Tax=Gorillibacterium sp. sgz500922 TaxID=3446694 RepID=UPI003F66EAA3